MIRFIDLTNKRFNKLVAISHENVLTGCGRKRIHWLCQCDCGNKVTVEVSNLKTGNIKSCGCSRLGNTNATIHGMIKTRTYNVWRGMKDRCNNKNVNNYERYGGRGIKVCDHWRKFSNFFADMGKCPKNMSIDRIDNSLGYSKENCKWATIKEQNNNKRTNTMITHNSETLTISQWADRSPVRYDTFRSRVMSYGWTMERALSESKHC